MDYLSQLVLAVVSGEDVVINPDTDRIVSQPEEFNVTMIGAVALFRIAVSLRRKSEKKKKKDVDKPWASS